MEKFPEQNLGFQDQKTATESLTKLSGKKVNVEVVSNSVTMFIEGTLSYIGDRKWHVETVFDASLNFSIEDVSTIGKQDRSIYRANYILITPQ